VDLSRLDPLKSLRWTADELQLGGLTTYWDAIRTRGRGGVSAASDAARQVGAIQIQHAAHGRGTSSRVARRRRTGPMAYDRWCARVAARAGRKSRSTGSIQAYKEMKRRPDQLVVGIRIPRRRYAYQVFEKVGARRAQAIATVGLPSSLRRRLRWWRRASPHHPPLPPSSAARDRAAPKVPVIPAHQSRKT